MAGTRFSLNRELLHARLGPEVTDELIRFEQALNTMAQQTNANPLGPVDPPPQISAVTVTPKGGGVHQVTIQDNNPIERGVEYFAEYSQTPDFSTFTSVPMGPSRQVDVPVGTGPVYWKAYSAKKTSAPSAPIYHGGTEAAPAAVDSQGTTAAVSAGIPGTGTGTEPSTDPRGSAGYGFDPVRSAASVEIPVA